MSYRDDILRRQARALEPATPAAYRHIQPAWPAPPPARWAQAAENWRNFPGSASYVVCNPCRNATGAGVDATTSFRVYLPRAGGMDPNVEAGQVIAYVGAVGEAYAAVGGYLDDAIGTIKMWAHPSADPPAGWTECSGGGTPGRDPATVAGLEGTFPVARKIGDDDFGVVGQTGNLNRKTHSHALEMNMLDPPCADAWIHTGTWDTRSLAAHTANHLPPWCVVRFIERYDNAANS